MNDRVFKHTEAHKLEDPERLKWLPAAEILAHLRVAPGMKVADVGAGTGYFSIPIARAVGALGHVFAVDLQPEMLALLRGKLSDQTHLAISPCIRVLRRSYLCLTAAFTWFCTQISGTKSRTSILRFARPCGFPC